MKYEQWLQNWFDYYVKPISKQRTLIKYQQQLESYILPELGKYQLEDLSAQTLQEFTVRLADSGLAPNTVNSVISTLKLSLRKAVLLGVAKCQFTDAIARPKTREKKVECLTKREQRKIERLIDESARDNLYGIVLSLYTGLRLGELLALKWQDVDFAKSRITVSKSCRDMWDEKGHRKIIETTKTQASERIIPLPKQLLPKLKEMKKKANGDFVISGRSQYGAQVRSYQRTFERILGRLNITHKGFHTLRHTFATRALEVGMDVKTLSEIMGHSDPTVTLKRYAHSMFEHKTEMMNRVGKLLL